MYLEIAIYNSAAASRKNNKFLVNTIALASLITFLAFAFTALPLISFWLALFSPQKSHKLLFYSNARAGPREYSKMAIKSLKNFLLQCLLISSFAVYAREIAVN